jgi:glutathione synthase/RimK-type ligase-like ATP-grasp enzyme
MILICGSPFDPEIIFLCGCWDAVCLPYRLLDLGRSDRKLFLRENYRRGLKNGLIRCENWQADLGEVSGLFFNNYTRLDKDSDSCFAECDPDLAAILNNLTCRVANRPASAMSNRSKPFQALQIRKSGFLIPETLVTNDPAVAKQFFDEHQGKVIFKSISGAKSIVRELSPEYLKRLPLLWHGPTQFQALITGDDIRVHVVGDRCFATRIRSASVDYRFAWQQRIRFEMEPVALSEDASARCIQLSRKLGLTFSGIDLKESPTGEYYCLEVNAAPGLSFYESRTHQPIGAALGEFLEEP